jgi:Ni/Fe-hydrogenase 1 B-type cytochrome subunit
LWASSTTISWQYQWFSNWIISLFGQSCDLHTWHHLVKWPIICFIIAHINVAIREAIMSR